MKRIAFIIGTGALGPIAMSAIADKDFAVEIFAFPGCPLSGTHQIFDLESISTALGTLSRFKPDTVCMIGGVTLTAAHRQSLADHFITLFGEDSFFEFLHPQGIIGDQTVSMMMVKIIAHMGAKIVGIHQLIPELVSPKGQIGAHKVSENLTRQIPDAISQCLAHARQDKGQAIIVANGTVQAVEEIDGTAAMIARFAANNDHPQEPAILIKCARPGQPLAIDMPAIGLDTIDQALNANIKLILVEAGRSLLIERNRLIAKANAANIALMGISVEDSNG